MNNCLLCENCETDGGYEEGFFFHYCTERELDNDTRFPYTNTKCDKFEKDTSICNLSNKRIPKELWDSIIWEIS